jgi:hypothetical protein
MNSYRGVQNFNRMLYWKRERERERGEREREREREREGIARLKGGEYNLGYIPRQQTTLDGS